MPDPIYLDHAATTPVRAEVLEAMLPFFGPRFGNPSSVHRWGRDARTALDEARERVARCLGATADEICFTSGGTEADNLAILGAWRGSPRRGRNAIVTTPIEHKAVLERRASRRRRKAPTSDSVTMTQRRRRRRRLIRRAAAATTRRSRRSMWINNEIGTIQPIAELARARQERRRALSHRRRAGVRQDRHRRAQRFPSTSSRSPATRSARPRESARSTSGAARSSSRCSMAARRIAAAVPGRRTSPRSIGFARAAELAVAEREEEWRRLERLRDSARGGDPRAHSRRRHSRRGAAHARAAHRQRLRARHGQRVDAHGARPARHRAARRAPRVRAEACQPSHVLHAIGVSPDSRAAAIRMSLGSLTTDAAVDRVAEVFPALVAKARGLVARRD